LYIYNKCFFFSRKVPLLFDFTCDKINMQYLDVAFLHDLSAFGRNVQTFPHSVRIKCFRLELKPFFTTFSISNAHFKCIFISSDSAVPDTLIDLFLTSPHSTIDDRPERGSTPFVRPPLNVSTHSDMLICHSSVCFTGLHTLS